MLLTVNTLHTYYPTAFFICLGLTLLLAGAGVFGAVTLRRYGYLTTYDAVAASILWCYAVAVLYFTVVGRFAKEDFRSEAEMFSVWRNALDGHKEDIRDLVLNLAMLAPVAFLFCELRRKKRLRILPALAVSLGFSIFIECLQYVSRTGTFEPDDIVNNFAGALAAVLVWAVWNAARNLRKKNSQ